MILPVKTDRLPTGFKMSLLKAVTKGNFDSAADIEAIVEEENGEPVLFVRFYEGPAAMADRRGGQIPTDAEARLDLILQGLPDVPTLMQTMPRAIRKAVQLAGGVPAAV